MSQSNEHARPVISYRTQDVDGLNIFYREAGPKDAPTLLLLHGFPTSSHMFRDLIPLLADRYHVVAPDYPGSGYSDAPSNKEFAYTFDHLADIIDAFTQKLGLKRYAIYSQDFGGPVGFRLATRHPERITAIFVQNAVAHEEGLSEGFATARRLWANRNAETEAAMRSHLTIGDTKGQYLFGAKDPARINPDAWMHAQDGLDRPGIADAQIDLLYDYQSNLRQYPHFQAYFRDHQPPMLITWGKHDPFFALAGAKAFAEQLPKAELHIFDGGHFLLEDHAEEVAALMREFLERTLV
ncbi:alpha/beta hydrolase [Phyllobacterium sp. OV277]|uniref:alpha/beta fold hydrolase n=1 Tax=Phyllobacterium sp. OV277 TaxID=1882772 RepID=UPI0008926A7B|nr:alpha/beta hydrolase [Phyllobacterium sp. OV277]SDO08568.1 Pimeloyl-ACP methyl ester carboxylesterase [Phyllobacterium sp. OV277]